MSKIALTGNASGTGTLTIAAPSTNTDRTLTLPDEAGTVLTSASTTVLPKGGPAFFAQAAAATIANTTFTKVPFSSEIFDTANCYDSTTNYRFTPNVAGYYQINGLVQLYYAPSTSGAMFPSLYKNGAGYVTGPVIPLVNGSESGGAISALVYLNGSTDYIELYVFQTSSGNLNLDTGVWSHFSGFLARAA